MKEEAISTMEVPLMQLGPSPAYGTAYYGSGKRIIAVVGGDGVIRVTMIAKVDDISIDFVYFLVREGHSFKLVDYEVEGALLSRNYRGHFNYLMRKYGFKGMMEKMHAKAQRFAQK